MCCFRQNSIHIKNIFSKYKIVLVKIFFADGNVLQRIVPQIFKTGNRFLVFFNNSHQYFNQVLPRNNYPCFF